jgi:signal transduction histidine kinase
MIQFTARLPERMVTATRGQLLLASLGAVALLIAALAWQAWTADRDHRRAAERTLRDQAVSAAWLFRVVLGAEASDAMSRAFVPAQVLPAPNQPDGLPPVSLLRVSADTIARCGTAADSLRFYFRLDLRSGALAILGNRLSAEVEQAVRDSARAHLYPDGMWYSLNPFRQAGDRNRTLVFAGRLGVDGKPVAVYGFETCAGSVYQPLFARALADISLLPPSLTAGVPNDSLVTVIATYGTTPDTLFRSAVSYVSAFTGTDRSPRKGGLGVQVTLRPELANRLIVGGLPHSRLPLLLGLLGMTLALLGVAFRQVRRERELAAVREDFVSSVSHELRTPLTQIRLFAETLHLGRAPTAADRAFAVDVILNESRRLIHLVENVLRFSSQQRAGTAVSRAPVALGAVARSVVETFAPLVAPREIECRLQVEEDFLVEGDAGAIRQILLNLLDNAVKFGPSGQVVIVTVCREGDRGILRVEDEGPGIAEEHHQRIWLPFVRIAGNANAAPGSGIGLAVVRDLAGAQGASVRVDRGSRGGALFTVAFPLPGMVEQVEHSFETPGTHPSSE